MDRDDGGILDVQPLGSAQRSNTVLPFWLRIILGVAITKAVLLAILIWSGLQCIHMANQKAFIQWAVTATKFFAIAIKGPVLSGELGALEKLVREIISNHPAITYARVLDRIGVMIAQNGERKIAVDFVADRHFEDVNDNISDTYAEIREAGVGLACRLNR